MQTIHLDVSNKGNIPTIYAKQGDVGRKFLVVITDAGIPRPIEDGDTLSIWYEGASGVGNYTDIGGESAFSIEGNTVTIEMIAQMLNNAGDGKLCLIMANADGDEIGTWNIPYSVEDVPGLGSKPAEQHLNALVDAQKKAEDSAARAEEYAKRAEQVDVNNAVLYIKQAPTEAQKAQARENIGAVDREQMTTEVNAALEAAKESGEFKGEKGDKGQRGEPGYTPIKGVDYYTTEEKAELVREIEQTAIGDIDAALYRIIAIQNELIGGGSV